MTSHCMKVIHYRAWLFSGPYFFFLIPFCWVWKCHVVTQWYVCTTLYGARLCCSIRCTFCAFKHFFVKYRKTPFSVLPSCCVKLKHKPKNNSMLVLSLYGSWVAQISTLKSQASILPNSNRKHFMSILRLQWISQPISFLLLEIKPGNNCF